MVAYEMHDRDDRLHVIVWEVAHVASELRTHQPTATWLNQLDNIPSRTQWKMQLLIIRGEQSLQ